MKFTFEANMKKGECYKCPIKQPVGKRWYCSFLDDFIGYVSYACPLEEATEVLWHQFPKEKPTEEYGYYLVTVADREAHEAIWSDGFYWDDEYDGSRIDEVTAWAEMPRPYEEADR